MPKFAVAVDHQLGQEEATSRLQQFVEKVRAEHADKVSDLQGAWAGHQLTFQFSAVGLPIQGQMHVHSEQVHVTGTLPLAAALFRGQIEQTIRGELASLLQS